MNVSTGKTYSGFSKKWMVFRYKHLHIRGLGNTLWKLTRLLIIFGLCFIIIYPYFSKIMDTFKNVRDLYNTNIKFIPQHFTTENLQRIVKAMSYWNSAAYTALYCLMISLIQTFVSAFVAYGFARFKFKGNSLLFGLVILTMIVPQQTIMIPLYTKFRFFLGGIKLVGTVMPTTILSFTCLGIRNGLFIFILRQFFRNLPVELEEAAYIDGNNMFQTFFKIILPSSLTMLTVIFILSFCWQWTDDIYSNMFMPNLPLMVNKVGAVHDYEIDVLDSMLRNSAAVLAVAPLAVLYIALQNMFIQGIERSGITG